MRKKIIGLLGCSLLALAGCSGTALVNSWDNASYAARPLHRVMVYVQTKDALTSNSAEDDLATSLQSQVDAISAYQVFGTTGMTPPPAQDRAKIRALLQAKGFDGVLVARLSNIKKSEHYVPPEPVGSFWGEDGFAGPYGDWGWGGYGAYYSPPAMLPGYSYTQTDYYVDCVLYAIPSGDLVWSAQTRSTDPDNKRKMIDEITRVFSANLKAANVLAR